MKKYTEKEVAIFKGTLTLASEGKNMHLVTVQDIANASGVGKGTIYDYFSAKEEIIVRTILYAMSLENAKAWEMVEEKLTFKEKIFAIYDIVLDSVTNRLSSFNMIASVGGIGELGEISEIYAKELAEISGESEKLFGEILKFGAIEGSILAPRDLEYTRMAVTSNILAIGKASVDKLVPFDGEKIKSNGYKMLVKTLN
ncbi:MAG: helix-turn-helix domain-containing protein [Oscillospiraceae bacterium]